MLRYILAFITALHGLIHLVGLGQPFGYGSARQITQDVSKPVGILWLFTALLFLVTTTLLLLKNQLWWFAGFSAVVFSQALILSAWNNAKWGTVANIIILLACILAFGSWKFEKRYLDDVQLNVSRTNHMVNEQLTEKDLQHLPLLVQKYLRYTGVVNKPMVKSMKATFDGQMRGKGGGWFHFTSEQYNFYDTPTRLFFMKGRMFGVTVPGYHAYRNGMASMQIKLFGIYPIVNLTEGVLNKAETVTLFNDMCILAPSTLVDSRIEWETIDSTSLKAKFTANGISVSAILVFNENGQLANFISDDRYDVGDMKQYRFSTPILEYKKMDGYNLASKAEAIWHYPEGAFTYGEFELKEITYNVESD